MQTVLPPELGALIACGGDPSKAVQRLGDALTPSVDWSKLMDLADEQAMLPLVARTVGQCPAGLVPPEILAEIRSRAKVKTMRSLLLAGELSRVLSQFDAAGLTPIAFKGPTLSHLAHGNLALRDSGDLDILVARRHLPAALDILAADGYLMRSPASIPGCRAPTQSPSYGAVPGLKWICIGSSQLLIFCPSIRIAPPGVLSWRPYQVWWPAPFVPKISCSI